MSSLLSTGLGLGAGFYIPYLNGFITDFFTSPQYRDSAQSHQFVVGITLSYGLLFALTSVVMLLVKISKDLVIFYPLSGLIALSLSILFRKLGSGIGTLDCSTHCVAEVVPLAAQETATTYVTYTLAAIFIVGVLVYVAKLNSSTK